MRNLRRPFYEFYVSTQSPLAAEVLARIRELYAIEAEIRGHRAEHRRRVRDERSRPIVDALHSWLLEHVERVSAVSDLAKAIRYAIRHWPGLVVFLDDGRVEMDTNVVERAIRPSALTRKNALFAGSDVGASFCSSGDALTKQRNSATNFEIPGAVTGESQRRVERRPAAGRQVTGAKVRGWPRFRAWCDAVAYDSLAACQRLPACRTYRALIWRRSWSNCSARSRS